MVEERKLLKPRGKALILLATLPGLGWPRVAAACPPAARVEGDEPLADTVRRILQNRGVAAREEEGCPATIASVTWTTAGVKTIVRDAAGRTQVHTVSEPGTAATVIESWARTDLGAVLLEARARPVVPSARDEEEPPPIKWPTPPATTPASFGVATGVARGGDASMWLDGTLSGCVLVGLGVCTGALLRTLVDLGQSGDSARLDGSRKGIDVLVTADYPIRAAGLRLVPGLGFGAGWLRTSVPRGPTGGRGDDEELGGLRLEAHLGCRVPLTKSVALDFGLAASLSPSAPRGDVTDFDEGVTMAGQPRWALRGGAGARFGEP